MDKNGVFEAQQLLFVAAASIQTYKFCREKVNESVNDHWESKFYTSYKLQAT